MWGVGCDVVQIPRIESLLDSFGDSFLARVFSEQEQKEAKVIQNSRVMASYYAKRFAAKEAFVKALGTGFGKVVSLKDIQTLRLPSGQPQLSIADRAQKKMLQLLGHKPVVYVSLSDDYPSAMAVVIYINSYCRLIAKSSG